MVKEYAGPEVSLADLDEAAARISKFYRQNGFPVARAYVPAQEVKDGVVEIAVLEGRFGKLDLRNSSRLSDALARATLSAAVERRRDRAVAARARSAAAQGPRRDRLRRHLEDPVNRSALPISSSTSPPRAPSRAPLEADNYGNRYTGELRLGGSVAAANLAGRGDLLSVRGLLTEEVGLWYGRAAYQIPVTGSGLKLGGAYSHTYYSLGQQFTPPRRER